MSEKIILITGASGGAGAAFRGRRDRRYLRYSVDREAGEQHDP